MTTLTEPQWGQWFDVTDLEATLSLAADIGLPLNIGLDHEGSPEVLEAPYRHAPLSGEVHLMLWRNADTEGFTVMNLAQRTTTPFSDLMEAVRFVREQWGADWPAMAGRRG